MAGGAEVRVARFDEDGPSSGGASTARLDELSPAVAALADSGGQAGSGAVADFGGPSHPGEPAPAAGGRAPGGGVAQLHAAGGPHAAGTPTARLDDAGGRRTRRDAVPTGAGSPEREIRPEDQRPRRAGSRRPRPDRGDAPSGPAARGTADPTERPPREAPARGGGPKQIDPDADPVAAAREICLRLLTDRARTRHELAQALRQRGVPDDAASSVLERFDEVGLIDDAAFAGRWVRSRHNHRGLARRAIAMELRRKGVDGEVAEEALGEVDADAESRRARELVDRKLRSLTVDTPEQRAVAVRRLVGMLARKGYGAGTAYGVVREALAAHGAEADELGAEPVDD